MEASARCGVTWADYSLRLRCSRWQGRFNTTPEDAARIAGQAGVCFLMLYHTIPPLPSAYLNAAFLRDAAKHFGARLR